MTKKWLITQNVIATILQAWALFFLYSFTDNIVGRLQSALHEGVINEKEINYVKMIGEYHLYYLSGILAGYAGLALMYDKKWGWLAAIASSLIFMGFTLVSARTGLASEDETKHDPYFISYLSAGFVFATIFILLVLKPFRAKYNPSLINWLAVGGIVLFAIVDQQLLGH